MAQKHAAGDDVAYFDQIAQSYDTLYQGPHDRAENWFVRRALIRLDLFNPRRHVLDVGAGTGHFLELGGHTRHYLPANVLSVEPAEGMRREFHRKFPHDQIIPGYAGDLAYLTRARHRFSGLVSLYGPYNYAGYDALAEIPYLLYSGAPFALVVYGPQWTYLPDPANPPSLIRWYPGLVKEAFAGTDVRDLRIVGFSSPFFRALPEQTPAALLRARLRWDELVLAPSQSRYLLITGVRF